MRIGRLHVAAAGPAQRDGAGAKRAKAKGGDEGYGHERAFRRESDEVTHGVVSRKFPGAPYGRAASTTPMILKTAGQAR